MGRNRPQLKNGESVVLPDGREVKFVAVDITALDDPCYGCVFTDEKCTDLNEIIGSCGSGRTDGLFGVFTELKDK